MRLSSLARWVPTLVWSHFDSGGICRRCAGMISAGFYQVYSELGPA
jgi:hypothetical protein